MFEGSNIFFQQKLFIKNPILLMNWQGLVLSFLFIFFFKTFTFGQFQNYQYYKGIVMDAQRKRPLVGAHVLVHPTTDGVVTDEKGEFFIKLSPGEDSLSVFYPGFKEKIVRITRGKMVIELNYAIVSYDTISVTSPETYESVYQVVRNEGPSSRSPNNFEYDESSHNHIQTEDYSPIEENRDKVVLVNPLSTFSIDVDRAAYSNVRRFLALGEMPPKNAVRIEEMINYFSYDYPKPGPKDPPFKLYTEFSECPWNKERKLLHIGIKGKDIAPKDYVPNNLVFLIDVSGSMKAKNKLPLVKKSLKLLATQLKEEDNITIIVYSGAAGMVLAPTSGADKERIFNAIDNMEAGGSTAGGAGIRLAYQAAEQVYVKGGNNRIILATDGDFNIGTSSDGALADLIESKRKSGVYLTVLGFGMGNYKDNKLEILADKGNGNYAYIDTEEEARKVLVEELPGTLFTIAKDVKIQVEFNPKVVKTYRLIGYENRQLQTEDFADDDVDAGELGAGHTVTALYEIEMATEDFPKSDLRYQESTLTNVGFKGRELGYLSLRYKAPESEDSELIELPISYKSILLARASKDFHFSAAVAGFGLKLRNSSYNKEMTYESIRSLASYALDEERQPHRIEFLKLVDQAALIDQE
jgi:Ca-activated chloride channel family protein